LQTVLARNEPKTVVVMERLNMSKENDNQRQVAVRVADAASDTVRAALLVWAQGLLQIRSASLPATQKAKSAIKLTAQSKVIWPITKMIAGEVKRLAWDDRSVKARFGLAGMAVGAAIFGGEGAGIAALGTAIGVPLWIVFGAGATFAGVLIEELTGRTHNPTTTYKVIEAEREDEN
jgi:hypothetical protein